MAELADAADLNSVEGNLIRVQISAPAPRLASYRHLDERQPCDIYIGSEFRIDVSSEAGNRFDQNVTGFRGEEESGFNAEPYIRTGKFVKVLGL